MKKKKKKPLLDFAKPGEEFDEKGKLADFLCLWPGFDKFVDKIYDCL